MPRRAAPALAALLLLATACGGGDDGGGGGSIDGGGGDPADAGDGAALCPVTGDVTCGGDLAGAWQFGALCPDPADQVPCQNPFDGEAACVADGNAVTCALAADGSLTFTGGDLHVVRTLTIETTYVFTGACVQAVRPEAADAAAACADLSNPPALACTFAADACTCLGRVEDEAIDETVPFISTDGTVSFDGFSATYCVAGDTLTLDFDPHPQSWRYWVLTR